MTAVRLHIPTFLAERDLSRLEKVMPAEAMEKVRKHLHVFQSWVAEPALRKDTVEEAVDHILRSGAAAAQFKFAFAEALLRIPGGLQAFFEDAASEGLRSAVPAAAAPDLLEAIEQAEAANRQWMRFLAFHPRSSAIMEDLEEPIVKEVIESGFHADNLLTVTLIGVNEHAETTRPEVLTGLAATAKAWVLSYRAAVQHLVEAFAPQLDAGDLFAPRTLDDLLALAPHDGPTATLHDMDAAIAGAVLDA